MLQSVMTHGHLLNQSVSTVRTVLATTNRMQIRSWESSLLGLCMLASAGCIATPTSTPAPPTLPAAQQRDEGYALLYKLMSDESNVSKLLIIKHADEPIHGLVKEISDFAKDAKKQMDEFKKADGALSFDASGLPAAEQEARELTSKTDAKELLTSSGKVFELRLVFTQAQAMGYGADLSKAMETHEDNPSCKDFLTSVAQRCGQFRDRLMGVLGVK